ncbi:MAG: hypothetical protein WD768_17890 [Phycisphaeraceae bacterium]
MTSSLRHTIRVTLLTALVTLAACRTSAAPQPLVPQAVDLRAGMPAIEKPGVPLLHEKVTEADDNAGLALDSSEAFVWRHAPVEGGAKFNLSLGTDASDSFDRAVLTVWDWHNQPVFQRAFNGAAKQNVTFAVHGNGTYLLTLDAFAKDKCVYRLIRSVSVSPDAQGRREAWKGSDYWLGICAFPGRYHWTSGGKPVLPEGLSEQQAREREAELIAKLGLTHARLDVSMVMPENDKQAIDWKRMDAAVNAVTPQAAERLALQVMHPPDWAIDPKYKDETKDRWRFPRREDAYRRYVRQLVTRYGKHAAFIQIYNEPDQVEFWPGEPAEYLKEVEWAKDEIRKLLPDVTITNGGYAFIDPKKSEYYINQLKGKLDLQAYHSHGNLRELIRDREMMGKLHTEAGYEKPRFINTECGYAAWRLDQERAQAIAILQKIVYAWAHGDEGMLLFCSRMTKGPGPPGRSGRDFGLLDYNFCPRFAYGAVAAFTNTYAGAKFERVLSGKGNVHAYVFAKGADKLVAIFTMDKPEKVTLESDAKAAARIDAMGNSTKLEASTKVNIDAGQYLTTIVLNGATHVELRE